MQGYNVYIQKENKMVVTQHVNNIDTLHDAQNTQVYKAMANEEKEDAGLDLHWQRRHRLQKHASTLRLARR